VTGAGSARSGGNTPAGARLLRNAIRFRKTTVYVTAVALVALSGTVGQATALRPAKEHSRLSPGRCWLGWQCGRDWRFGLGPRALAVRRKRSLLGCVAIAGFRAPEQKIPAGAGGGVAWVMVREATW
jgi:hypothetical protein